MIPNGSIKEARRVLLIENSPADRQLLRSWLTAERIEVHEAVDIISGLAACARLQPDLILVQVRLPTWDGFEVIRRLKDNPRTLSIPVICLAGCATTAEKARGIDMGAVDFVSKPFDPVELLARVHSALRTKAYLDLLEHRAHIDGLTELSNRHALQLRLPQEWDGCLRRGMPLALSIVDLDHFKRINDRHGHTAGDEVLRQLAATLRRNFRETDFIARYGGEEFVVLAPNCDLTCAVARAETLRKAVAALNVAFHTATITLTISAGIAIVNDPTQATPDEVFGQADEALYRAKGAGRNDVWIWDPRHQAPAAAETWRADIADKARTLFPAADSSPRLDAPARPDPSSTASSY